MAVAILYDVDFALCICYRIRQRNPGPFEYYEKWNNMMYLGPEVLAITCVTMCVVSDSGKAEGDTQW